MLTVNNVCECVCVLLSNTNKINFTASLENMQTAAKEKPGKTQEKHRKSINDANAIC